MKQQKYHWLRFWRLEREETFHIGKTCYEKLGLVLAVSCHEGRLRVFMPWTRVKTTRPYGRVVPNPFSTELQTLTGKGPTVNVSTGSDTDAP